ncbi:MAG: hypothetical protein GYB15_01540 [Gammaproteobacteria bacterium]|uniref:Uncharacterized protein n=1 Tax=Vreelandella titanicae TaxID=664683 RepID=A0A558J3A3_9GAMM|nr:hypothetical protein [Halomonas titanicae]MBR9902628.1 hypothetical protein [Gammaproteobacteria bacterium]TVU88131.1 hypothetical protein FQP89_17860 [Halomonas titanicae]
MSEQDQASGLRKWANLQRQQQQAEGAVDVAAAEPVAEHVSPLSTPTRTALEEPRTVAPPRPKIPLIVVGLPGRGVVQVSKVKARLGQWSTLGRNWAGEPDDWDIRIVMAETSELAQLSDQYSRWALWISSDADAFATMFRTLRQLHEGGGPRRLLALHEPHLPRQGLLDNLREAADYYLNMELLVLAR